MMRIFITGADGQLGTELQRVLSAHELTLGLWPGFDVTQADAEARIAAARPDVVIHAAAYTDVDGAEREPNVAWAVNVDGTERVARAAARAGSRLVYVSTDYVFDGAKRAPYTEADDPRPLNAYGRSKWEGERRAVAGCPGALVVRTAWLYGRHGKNFVKSVMQQATGGRPLRVVADQRGSPTSAADLARAIAHLIERTNLSGIVHAAGGGVCSWHEFAMAIIEAMGLTTAVVPITSAESGRAAPRPAYAALASSRLAASGFVMPAWRDALKQFMAEQGAVHAGH